MSHNSWSFLTPKTLLGRIFNFTAKCQAVSIQEQYLKYNVRVFDLRVRLDNNGKAIVAHGLFEYKDSMFRIARDLDFLNSKLDTYVRVFLEVRTKEQDTETQRHWFVSFCSHLEDKWPHIKFCGGYPTYNFAVRYYKFKHNLPPTKGAHASWATKTKLDDLWPWLYAKLHNKKSRAEHTDENVYLSLDFVNI